MSPALKRITALQHFECGNAVEIHNGIIFNFYPGLPHVLFLMCRLLCIVLSILGNVTKELCHCNSYYMRGDQTMCRKTMCRLLLKIVSKVMVIFSLQINSMLLMTILKCHLIKDNYYYCNILYNVNR